MEGPTDVRYVDKMVSHLACKMGDLLAGKMDFLMVS